MKDEDKQRLRDAYQVALSNTVGADHPMERWGKNSEGKSQSFREFIEAQLEDGTIFDLFDKRTPEDFENRVKQLNSGLGWGIGVVEFTMPKTP